MGIRKASHLAVERLIARFGYEMRMVGSPPCGYSAFLRRMVESGLNPRTVFDVGIGYGTPWLYEAFPKAHFVLIEPQKRFEPVLRDLCASMDAEYHLVGVGRAEQHLPIYELSDSPTGSSFLPHNERSDRHGGTTEKSKDQMHIIPLDTFQDKPGPCFLKIDTEGYELEVLHGALKVLEKTDVVLLEVAVMERHVGEPDLIEIGAFMKTVGFRLLDFPVMTPQAVDGPLVYVDAAFGRTDSSVVQTLLR